MDPVESFKIFQSAMKDEQLGVTDAFGRSPLHYAACRGATVCCMLLIKVSVEARNSTCQKCVDEVVRLLSEGFHLKNIVSNCRKRLMRTEKTLVT